MIKTSKFCQKHQAQSQVLICWLFLFLPSSFLGIGRMWESTTCAPSFLLIFSKALKSLSATLNFLSNFFFIVAYLKDEYWIVITSWLVPDPSQIRELLIPLCLGPTGCSDRELCHICSYDPAKHKNGRKARGLVSGRTKGASLPFDLCDKVPPMQIFEHLIKADILTLSCRGHSFSSAVPAIFMEVAEIKYIWDLCACQILLHCINWCKKPWRHEMEK